MIDVHYENKYSASAACVFCSGIIRCEEWCIRRSTKVYEAYEIVANPSALLKQDEIRLHALGVRWSPLCQCS